MKPINQIAGVCLLGLLLFTLNSCGRRATIASFTASPTSFTAGQTAKICYELVKAVSARIEPIGQLKDPTKSCVDVEPRQTTTYTLFATGADGNTVSNQITLNVAAPPPLAAIVRFEPKQETTAAPPGSAAELCYEVTGARTLEIKPDVGKVEPVDKGCRTVKPTRTTTYELAATGTDDQTVTKEATVKIVQPLPRIVRFDVSADNIKAGEKVSICYQVADATGANIENVNHDVKLGPVDCVDVKPKRTAVFALQARNLDGRTVRSEERRVTVEQLPVEIVFRAQPDTVEEGNGTVLSYRISNAWTAQITSEGKVIANLTAAEGNQPITPARTATYTLTAKDPNGKPASSPVTVTVVPPRQARILKFDPPSQTIALGGVAKLCYGVTSEASVTIHSLLQPTPRPTDSSKDKCFVEKPRKTDIFTLTATGQNGSPVTRQARVVVSVPQPVIQFWARTKTGRQGNPNLLIGRGEQVQLCYRLANVAQAQINPGNIAVGQANCLDLNDVASTTVYTLSARGIDGTTTNRQVTVQVYPPPRIVGFGTYNNDRRSLCYEFQYGARAEITPQIGLLRNARGCVPMPAPFNPPYTLRVHGYGNVPDAVMRFPR